MLLVGPRPNRVLPIIKINGPNQLKTGKKEATPKLRPSGKHTKNMPNLSSGW